MDKRRLHLQPHVEYMGEFRLLRHPEQRGLPANRHQELALEEASTASPASGVPSAHNRTGNWNAPESMVNSNSFTVLFMAS